MAQLNKIARIPSGKGKCTAFKSIMAESWNDSLSRRCKKTNARKGTTRITWKTQLNVLRPSCIEKFRRSAWKLVGDQIFFIILDLPRFCSLKIIPYKFKLVRNICICILHSSTNSIIELREFEKFSTTKTIRDILGWQLSDCGFFHYHLMKKSVIS